MIRLEIISKFPVCKHFFEKVPRESISLIEKSAPKGYYSYNVCMNTKKLKITGTAEGTVYIYVPVSQAYRSIVYNKSNASYSGVVRY